MPPAAVATRETQQPWEYTTFQDYGLGGTASSDLISIPHLSFCRAFCSTTISSSGRLGLVDGETKQSRPSFYHLRLSAYIFDRVLPCQCNFLRFCGHLSQLKTHLQRHARTYRQGPVPRNTNGTLLFLFLSNRRLPHFLTLTGRILGRIPACTLVLIEKSVRPFETDSLTSRRSEVPIIAFLRSSSPCLFSSPRPVSHLVLDPARLSAGFEAFCLPAMYLHS